MTPNFNRYLTRTVDHDVARSQHQALVYTKMGPFVINGLIEGERERVEADTGVHAGRRLGGTVELPLGISP